VRCHDRAEYQGIAQKKIKTCYQTITFNLILGEADDRRGSKPGVVNIINREHKRQNKGISS
jgi:hypothetical protein